MSRVRPGPRRMPVADGVDLIYTGPLMGADAVAGPVSGNGYWAETGSTVLVERVDVKAMLKSGDWTRPPRRRRKRKVEAE